MSCDSIVQILLHKDGKILDVGRRRRLVTAKQRLALEQRDATCRFPGCDRKAFTDAHHVRHWAQGGRTDMDNLVLLCRFHHRLVHEGGFSVSATGDGHFTFAAPDGSPIPEHVHLGPARLAHLMEQNRGLAIGPTTCLNDYAGDRLDVAEAIVGILQGAGLTGSRAGPAP